MDYYKFEKIFNDNYMIYLDTNCLLSLYKLSDKLLNNYIIALSNKMQNIRISPTVKTEYERNVQNTKKEINKDIQTTYTNLDKNINDILNNFEKLTKQLIINDVSLEDTKLSDIKNNIDLLEQNIEHTKNSIPSVSSNKEKLGKAEAHINNLFLGTNMIKNKTESERIRCIIDGHVRSIHNYPPGYMDMKKKYYKRIEEATKHSTKLHTRELTDYLGDYFIWTDILHDKVGSKNKLFITNDMKEDWWDIPKNKKPEDFTPRKELTDEFSSINADSHIEFIPFKLFVHYLTIYLREDLYESFFLANGEQLFTEEIEETLMNNLKDDISDAVLDEYHVERGLIVTAHNIEIESISVHSFNILDIDKSYDEDRDMTIITFDIEYYYEGEGTWNISLGLDNEVYENDFGTFRIDDSSTLVKAKLVFSRKLDKDEPEGAKELIELEDHEIMGYYDESIGSISFESDFDYDIDPYLDM